MVFIIQKSQNKDSKAVRLELNELIAASNRIVDVEDLDEKEIDTRHQFYEKTSSEFEEEK